LIPTFEDKVHWGLALPFFVAAVLIQAALAPTTWLLGARLDLLLVMTVSWALIRSCEEAMVASLPAALLLGLLGTGPIGVSLLALMPPIGLSLVVRSGNPNPRLLALCLATAVCTVAALAVEIIVRFLGGEQNINLSGLWAVLLGETILNTLVAALLYWPLSIGRTRKLVRRTGLSLS
jgi:rod shape-determining protein MreD